MRGYMGVTIKFTTPPPSLAVVKMAVALRYITKEHGQRHTGERLSTKLTDILDKFDLLASEDADAEHN